MILPLAFALTLLGPAEQPPSIVFFLVDDLGWKDLGCTGSEFYETPNIDAFARSGTRFTQAYAACPVCSPTRASILTGKYPARLDTTDYFGAAQPERWKRNSPLLPAPYVDRLPLEEVTLPEILKEHGYATFFAGKWHLGGEGFFPEDQGFDVNKGGLARGGPYGGKKYFSPYGNPRLEDGPDGEHLPARLARETCDFIREHRSEPFLAYLSFYSVHTPLMAREDLKEKYQEKRKARAATDEERWGKEGRRKLRQVQDHAVYGGMVEAVDQAVGQVLATLDELGLAKNTIVVFFSDNGGLSTSEGHPTSNLPLRAGKGWLYEGGIREPLILRWPGRVKPESTDDTPVISTDFCPTLLSLAGLPARPDHHPDGVDFSPLLDGKPLQARPLFWHYPHYGNQGGSPGAVIREGNWKLIEFFQGPTELYDLASDPGESKNLMDAHPERVKAMRERLRTWQKSVDAKIPATNPKYQPKR